MNVFVATFAAQHFNANPVLHPMKKISLLLICALSLAACKNKSGKPDVSAINAAVTISRFDLDFFRTDTNNIAEGLRRLQAAYPDFYSDFMQWILMVSGADSNARTQQVTREFIRFYTPLQQHLTTTFQQTDGLKKELEQAFRYVKYYVPGYKVPPVIFFTGPFDAPGVANTTSGIAFGLQQYAGQGYEAYQSPAIQELFPAYISRRFSSVYMAANGLKAVVQELFPDRSAGKPLIEQMIEKGKQWYVLDKFMPDAPDSVKTGYTAKQLEWCAANEGMIWSYLVKNEDLNSLRPDVLQIYIGEAPFTQGMPQEYSPGNLGQWIGWQIVKKYMAGKSGISLETLMRTDPRIISQEAKYKPK